MTDVLRHGDSELERRKALNTGPSISSPPRAYDWSPINMIGAMRSAHETAPGGPDRKRYDKDQGAGNSWRRRISHPIRACLPVSYKFENHPKECCLPCIDGARDGRNASGKAKDNLPQSDAERD